jgi:diguanylate cyclase (GGDEF)-like protein
VLKGSAVKRKGTGHDGVAAAKCGELLIELADRLHAEVVRWQTDSSLKYAFDEARPPLKEAIDRLLGATAAAADMAKTGAGILAVPRQSRLPDSTADILQAANEHLVLAALQSEILAAAAEANLTEIARSSQRDELTGTHNRSMMLAHISYAIAMAQRHSKHVAVFFVDIDGFKSINDTYGHAMGDAVLQRVARRLESSVRASDAVSRHGGDEFLVVLAEVAHRRDVMAIAAKMLSALSKPDIPNSQMPLLSASIGISLYPDDGIDAASLISRADAAMYRAKKNGRNRFECYASRSDATLS